MLKVPFRVEVPWKPMAPKGESSLNDLAVMRAPFNLPSWPRWLKTNYRLRYQSVLVSLRPFYFKTLSEIPDLVYQSA
jgi:hypothetical protein